MMGVAWCRKRCGWGPTLGQSKGPEDTQLHGGGKEQLHGVSKQQVHGPEQQSSSISMGSLYSFPEPWPSAMAELAALNHLKP